MMEVSKKTYCQFVNALEPKTLNPNKNYHDNEYGFPISDDRELFARLILEINQAGLSWSLILDKKDHFYEAYDNFEIAKVAAYTEEDISRLLQNSKIIRNKLKIHAAIYNAKQIVKIQSEMGSFKNWLDFHYPKDKDIWIVLFKQYFKFIGGEIVNEFLMSSGYLPGAHDLDCPIHNKVLEAQPKWVLDL